MGVRSSASMKNPQRYAIVDALRLSQQCFGLTTLHQKLCKFRELAHVPIIQTYAKCTEVQVWGGNLKTNVLIYLLLCLSNENRTQRD